MRRGRPEASDGFDIGAPDVRPPVHAPTEGLEVPALHIAIQCRALDAVLALGIIQRKHFRGRGSGACWCRLSN